MALAASHSALPPRVAATDHLLSTRKQGRLLHAPAKNGKWVPGKVQHVVSDGFNVTFYEDEALKRACDAFDLRHVMKLRLLKLGGLNALEFTLEANEKREARQVLVASLGGDETFETDVDGPGWVQIWASAIRPDAIDESIESAVHPPLTALFNRQHTRQKAQVVRTRNSFDRLRGRSRVVQLPPPARLPPPTPPAGTQSARSSPSAPALSSDAASTSARQPSARQLPATAVASSSDVGSRASSRTPRGRIQVVVDRPANAPLGLALAPGEMGRLVVTDLAYGGLIQAAGANIQEGDQLLSINGNVVESLNGFVQLLSGLAGELVFELLRSEGPEVLEVPIRQVSDAPIRQVIEVPIRQASSQNSQRGGSDGGEGFENVLDPRARASTLFDEAATLFDEASSLVRNKASLNSSSRLPHFALVTERDLGSDCGGEGEGDGDGTRGGSNCGIAPPLGLQSFSWPACAIADSGGGVLPNRMHVVLECAKDEKGLPTTFGVMLGRVENGTSMPLVLVNSVAADSLNLGRLERGDELITIGGVRVQGNYAAVVEQLTKNNAHPVAVEIVRHGSNECTVGSPVSFGSGGGSGAGTAATAAAAKMATPWPTLLERLQKSRGTSGVLRQPGETSGVLRQPGETSGVLRQPGETLQSAHAASPRRQSRPGSPGYGPLTPVGPGDLSMAELASRAHQERLDELGTLSVTVHGATNLSAAGRQGQAPDCYVLVWLTYYDANDYIEQWRRSGTRRDEHSPAWQETLFFDDRQLRLRDLLATSQPLTLRLYDEHPGRLREAFELLGEIRVPLDGLLHRDSLKVVKELPGTNENQPASLHLSVTWQLGGVPNCGSESATRPAPQPEYRVPSAEPPSPPPPQSSRTRDASSPMPRLQLHSQLQEEAMYPWSPREPREQPCNPCAALVGLCSGIAQCLVGCAAGTSRAIGSCGTSSLAELGAVCLRCQVQCVRCQLHCIRNDPMYCEAVGAACEGTAHAVAATCGACAHGIGRACVACGNGCVQAGRSCAEGLRDCLPCTREPQPTVASPQAPWPTPVGAGPATKLSTGQEQQYLLV